MENEKIEQETVTIPKSLYDRLKLLGIIDDTGWRAGNFDSSDYAKHLIQPWALWIDYDLNPWDADIIKRVLRKKGYSEETMLNNRKLDYHKIIHVCQERLRQINLQTNGTQLQTGTFTERQ